MEDNHETVPESAGELATADTSTGRRRRRWPLWAATAAIALIGIGGAGGYAYASHYADTAVPGTHVGGIDVSGKTRAQIADLVTQRAEAATVTISGDVKATASLADLGTTVDADATADAALRHSEGILDRFTALFDDNNVAVVTTKDDVTATAYATALIPTDQAKPVNATVVARSDSSGFATTPAVNGVGIDPTDLIARAATAAETLSSQDVSLSFISTPPAVSDADATAAADKANAIAALDVTVATDDPEVSFTADVPTKVSWIHVEQSGKSVPAITIDSSAVGTWVAQQSAEISHDPVTGVRNINSRGDVVSTQVEAENGIVVANAEDVTSAIAQSLTNGTAYAGTFTTSEVAASWEDRLIADGAENLVYQAANGEKWIDVNLSSKTVTAYEGATVVMGPVSIVDGAPETPTVTGTFKIYLKYQAQDMGCAPGWDYCTKDVPWVSYFTGSFAFHGAPWRASFGYSGSHGCINMPVSSAQWIYNWGEIGTPVVSHY